MKTRRAARNRFKCALRRWQSLHRKRGEEWKPGITKEEISQTFDKLEKTAQAYLRTFPGKMKMEVRGSWADPVKIRVLPDIIEFSD
jgi:hypothetical protein